MQVRTYRNAIEIDFLDGHCGCRRVFRLETAEEGDLVIITASTFPQELEDRPARESRTVSFSAVKALAAAMLLLEV